MNIKYLLGSFLILLVAASAMTPVLGASNTQNSSHDVKFVKFKMIDDVQWENMTDEEKEAYLGQFEISDEGGRIRVSMHGDGGANFKFVTMTLEEYNPVNMKLLEDMSAEERESYFLARYKENLDIEVASGNLTQAEADELYAEYQAGDHKHMRFFTASTSVGSLTEEEIEALKDMTEDEREAFLLEQFKQTLSEAVAEGKLTQEQADEMLEARETGKNVGFKIHGEKGGFSIKVMEPLSEEELSTLQEMTEDDKKEFFLAQIKSNLNADVAAGKITQEEADEILAYHESGSAGYTSGNMFHRTTSFRIDAPAAAE